MRRAGNASSQGVPPDGQGTLTKHPDTSVALIKEAMPYARPSIAIAHQRSARIAIHVGVQGFENTGLLTGRGVAR